MPNFPHPRPGQLFVGRSTTKKVHFAWSQGRALLCRDALRALAAVVTLPAGSGLDDGDTRTVSRLLHAEVEPAQLCGNCFCAPFRQAYLVRYQEHQAAKNPQRGRHEYAARLAEIVVTDEPGGQRTTVLLDPASDWWGVLLQPDRDDVTSFVAFGGDCDGIQGYIPLGTWPLNAMTTIRWVLAHRAMPEDERITT